MLRRHRKDKGLVHVGIYQAAVLDAEEVVKVHFQVSFVCSIAFAGPFLVLLCC
eukprot:NODE_18205_length_287_cov_0.831933_g17037_i0.p4 GENE.NODE_18205_length_287_cov_0.831933_g17037_i0~~NODE_18205_length_287_cov_0.831933_g17037_i0.p4  ORF type:complete len:53 (-),score=8.96 NODE_18205_length_287_cov_0.831933_g17037_i0:13-171(-)